MSQWVKLCTLAEAPQAGQVMEAQAGEFAVCLANVEGELRAVDNWCPHRRGPLGQGWLEGNAVVCPWHSWTFNLKTGECEYPGNNRVSLFPVSVQGEDVLVDVE